MYSGCCGGAKQEKNVFPGGKETVWKTWEKTNSTVCCGACVFTHCTCRARASRATQVRRLFQELDLLALFFFGSSTLLTVPSTFKEIQSRKCFFVMFVGVEELPVCVWITENTFISVFFFFFLLAIVVCMGYFYAPSKDGTISNSLYSRILLYSPSM